LSGGRAESSQESKPQQERRKQIGKHDPPQQRRPVEDEKCAEASQRENCDMDQAECQAPADHPHPFACRSCRVGDDPRQRGCRDPSEDPFDSGPQTEEAEHEENNVEGGSALELLRQQIGGSPDLVGQMGHRRRQGS
jgi:hypothetical protein